MFTITDCLLVFHNEWGVKQSCPLPIYIFIMCIEILANAIRKDTKINGKKIKETECKISQYADGTHCYISWVDGSINALQASLNILIILEKISGLEISNSKTKVLWIGTLCRNTEYISSRKKSKMGNRFRKKKKKKDWTRLRKWLKTGD